ncbi:PorP/SprF family type IX secretion system membrane protein [Cyclobacterium plantarum]|uniref:Type IX secretion system membrane protein PorP/SprF n=1 Tax=Cyclobacterium plantarum TaxID=2716263 RepID=A0ABX0H670_9BACT|nr:PorP/SprF family type IX secretion system membrane protein [Cyclobacterium plantarum]NHE57359.1 type IX secretion system membrane protein PorP/SprF [Cyclobacterium plantarum]
MKNVWTIGIACLCLITGWNKALGQDFHFTQFYAAPLNLSPAFAGAMETSRVGLNYRKQWPGLGYDFNAAGFYFDTYLDKSNVGIGLSASQFTESFLSIRSADIAGYISYRLKLGDESFLRFGGQFGVVNRSLTLEELVFGDQIDLLNRTVNPTTIDRLPGEDSNWYPDLSFGALLQVPDFWLGISSHHVTRPNIGFLDNGIGNNLPIKWGVHGGYVKNLDNRMFKTYPIRKVFSVSFNYKRQGTFQQIELIPQLQVENFIGGLGFRNITRFNDLPDQNSINAVLGFNLPSGITMAYSYDYMLNRFSNPAHVSHEISIYFTDLKKKSLRDTLLPCPPGNANWNY